MKQTQMIRTLLVLLLFMPGCGEKPVKEGAKGMIPRSVPAKTDVVALTEGITRYKAPGTVKSVTVAPLSSKIMGTVLEVKVRAGDRVQKGQLLVILDSRETHAMVQKSQAGLTEAEQTLQEMDRNIESAQFNLNLASTTLKRYEELANQKSVSPQEFDEVRTRQESAAASLDALRARKKQIEARMQQAESDVQSARALLSYTQITSPLNGAVLARQVEPGMLAAPGMPLLTVEETDHYQLEVMVEERKMAGLKTGQIVALRIDAIKPPELKGPIAEVQPAADPASRTFVVKVNLPQNSQLRAGQYGEAFFDGGLSKGIWIQSGSIIRQGQLEGVYVLEKDNRIRLRLVKLGEITGRGIEVLSGLEAGETYVTQLSPELCDGCIVEASR
jgi:membrane fusion protein, multidrug efflux system